MLSIFGKGVQFQTALPMRGVTTTCAARPLRAGNFNPHSPCGE